MATTWLCMEDRVSIKGVVAEPGRAERVGLEETVPVVDEQRDKFVVDIWLSVGICTKPILNIWRGRVVGLASLRWNRLPPGALPFEVLQGPPHLFNCELHLFFVPFSSCLGPHSVSTVGLVLFFLVESRATQTLTEYDCGKGWCWVLMGGSWISNGESWIRRDWTGRTWLRARHSPDPGLLKFALRHFVNLVIRSADVCLVQLQEIALPSGG